MSVCIRAYKSSSRYETFTLAQPGQPLSDGIPTGEDPHVRPYQRRPWLPPPCRGLRPRSARAPSGRGGGVRPAYAGDGGDRPCLLPRGAQRRPDHRAPRAPATPAAARLDGEAGGGGWPGAGLILTSGSRVTSLRRHPGPTPFPNSRSDQSRVFEKTNEWSVPADQSPSHQPPHLGLDRSETPCSTLVP